MQVILTAPLKLVIKGKKLEFLPVVMQDIPSDDDAQWEKFIKKGGKRLPIDSVEAIQEYMKKHDTEAVSEDAETAFTVSGMALVECLPENI